MSDDYLYHYGVTGQRWGIRRYQNLDGSRTIAGTKHQEALNRKYADSNNSAKGSINKPNKSTNENKNNKKSDADKPKKSTEDQEQEPKENNTPSSTVVVHYWETRQSYIIREPATSAGNKIANDIVEQTPEVPRYEVSGFNTFKAAGQAALKTGTISKSA